jgi:hypothetical protein
MPNNEPTRIRVQLYSTDAGKLVQGISAKYRSTFIEMAVIAWLKTPAGKAATEALLLRGPNADNPKALIKTAVGKKSRQKEIQSEEDSQDEKNDPEAETLTETEKTDNAVIKAMTIG